MYKQEDIKSELTTEQVVSFMEKELEAGPCREDGKGNFIFRTVCHNGCNEGSHKLYYYPEAKSFHCYTQCGDSFDIYTLIQKAKDVDFIEAKEILKSHFNILSLDTKQEKSSIYDEDFFFLSQYEKIIKEKKIKTTIFDKHILNYFSKLYPSLWTKEGITYEALDKYNILVDLGQQKIIIPHFDKYGNLIGIRGRATQQWEVAAGYKYTPFSLEKNWFNHPVGEHLYGFDKNKEFIKKVQKILIVEGEKSVMKIEGYYPEHNFSVAVCGSNITDMQRDIILDSGAKEVTIAFDKMFNDDNEEQQKEYYSKLVGLAHKFTPYITTYIIWDDLGLTNYKDAPVDSGKESFEKLLKNKKEIKTKEIK